MWNLYLKGPLIEYNGTHSDKTVTVYRIQLKIAYAKIEKYINKTASNTFATVVW